MRPLIAAVVAAAFLPSAALLAAQPPAPAAHLHHAAPQPRADTHPHQTTRGHCAPPPNSNRLGPGARAPHNAPEATTPTPLPHIAPPRPPPPPNHTTRPPAQNRHLTPVHMLP